MHYEYFNQNKKRKGQVMKTVSILFFAFLVHTNSFAQNQTAISGQSNQIKFNIANVVNANKCNIEVTLPNQQKIGVEVEGPQFIAGFEFTPQQTGSTTITWEGKTKVRGLASVFACPGSGIIQVQVNGNTDQVAQQWNQYFSRVPEEIRDCVKVGMDLSQLKYQSLADPNALLTSPDDAKLKPIYEKCDNFAKQNQPRKAAPCTLPSQNNLKTICDGVYAERQPDGRLKTISRANAVQLHFEGKPWTVGVLENTDARTTRLKQEDEDKSKQAANIAAQKEAEEKDRKFKESPEYKKQQADLERKRIADEKEAARKQAEMERVRVAEEKQAAALKAKEEQERELKAQKEKAALETQRAQEEKSRQQKYSDLEQKRIADEKEAARKQATTSTSNQSSMPLRGFNDVMKVAFEIANNNPKWINHLMTNSNIDDVAICSALGMKMMAFAAVNPDSLSNDVAKVQALNAAGMTKAMQNLVDRGAMPKGYVMNYVKIFNPQSMQEVMDKNFQTCDRLLEIKLIDRNDIASFLRRPFLTK